MGEREIRYCTTEDGVRIAWCSEGEGYPVLVPPWTWESLSTRFNYDFVTAWLGPLQRGRRLLHWDMRGTGLSQHGPIAGTAEELAADAIGVMKAAGVARAAVLASVLGGPHGICLAGVQPDAVSHLVLYDTWGSPRDMQTPEEARLFATMARTNWEMTSQAVADQVISVRESHPELALQTARGFRDSISGDEFARLIETSEEHADAAWRVAGRIKAETLILHHVGNQLTPFAAAQSMAAHIPDARLVPLEGVIGWAGLADLRPVHERVNRFLPSATAPDAGETDIDDAPPGTEPAGIAVILFIDIADSTPLTERMGDAAFHQTSKSFDARAREAIRSAGGTPVEGKVLGDGVLAMFSSAAQAIAAARRCTALSAESEILLHIGLHAGDVIRDGDNVYGGAVNLAARVCSESAPGETLVSATVRDLARTSAGVTFEDRGERALKGIEDLQRLYAVRWQE